MPKLGLPNVTCVKLNWKFKMVNAINDCVAYRCSHLRAYAGLRFGSSLRTLISTHHLNSC